MADLFFQKYFEYVGETESPLTYHRWCAISMIGALLERQFSFPFGHIALYPNQYIMLAGEAGARKSSAIGVVEKLAKKVGYTKFAADKQSKEQFLASMMKPHESTQAVPDEDIEDILNELLDTPLGKTGELDSSSIFTIADEFLDLVGPANQEFLTMLTKLWDCKPDYKHPKIHGADVLVSKPTVNILAGATPTGLNTACPPEVVGHGFMSRLLLIWSDPSHKRFYLPRPPNKELEEELVNYIKEILSNVKGEATVTAEAHVVMERIYKEFPPLEDYNFKYYNSRRYTHMLKISMALAAMDLTTTIDAKHIVNANTILHYAERKMHKALSEFGKAKHTSSVGTILTLLSDASKPVSLPTIWRAVSQDLTRQQELTDIMKNLIYARKIKAAADGEGFVIINQERTEWGSGLIDDSIMQDEELE